MGVTDRVESALSRLSPPDMETVSVPVAEAVAVAVAVPSPLFTLPLLAIFT